ncbi:isoleucine--tRNA ligase [bacterium]|nr:isoleucine--tRNA ligase [bacterium]
MAKKHSEKLIINDFRKTPDFAHYEEIIADYWDEEKIFERSLEQTRDKEPYVFYDGPPFSTGLPNYGHLVASTTKDVFPRYQTMKVRYVKRSWGWDCHGLPIENIIEKELNLPDRPSILAYGVDNFCDACRSKVQLYTQEWKKTIRRLGRFVDMEHPYKTMDLDFMDKVWGVFKQLWDKGLIYQDYKVMYLCPRCSTPLSNFEVTQGYKEVTDISVYVRFKLNKPADLDLSEPTYLVAWTTTPWTLPGNMLLAVGKEIVYAVAQTKNEAGEQENLIVAKEQVADVLGEKEYTIVRELPGSELVGRTYEPPFAYFAETENAFRVVEADFVTLDEGTGIVHIAPAYGEDDFLLGKREGVAVHHHVDMTGRFTKEVKDFVGMAVKPIDKPQATDIEIIKYLAHQGKLLAKKKIKHAYPHCWRCDTPLLNYATSSFFVKTTALKKELLAGNQKINWQPEHFKNGRFGKWLENVRDWAISRNRFWGTPLPLWRSEDGDIICVGGQKELEKLSRQKVNDLHKNTVDKVKIKVNGKEYTRVDEVLDCWFESGSMPYALGQFPADFISEGQDQTRGWFYTLHVLATALKNEPAFANVLVNGIVLAEDGKKMSKKLHNYPDPQMIFDKYGADALRLYLMISPVMKAENLNFSEADVGRLRRQVSVIGWNCLVFWKQTGAKLEQLPKDFAQTAHVLDKYLEDERQKLIVEVTRAMDEYRVVDAGRKLIEFVDLLSTFYVRLSRERLKTDKNSQAVLGQALYTFALLIAPIMPFLAELFYHNLGGKMTSVHLENWPKAGSLASDEKLGQQMELVRQILQAGNSERRALQIKNRQPLASLKVSLNSKQAKIMQTEKLNEELVEIIKNELNVKEVIWETKAENLAVEFDTTWTPELEAEGRARELIREINNARKKAGLSADDDFSYSVSDVPEGWKEEIEARTKTKLKIEI